tara:strand:+ start:915 stop:2981 length:2067 start_codon:yes stop_codon:yes gene_type:complete
MIIEIDGVGQVEVGDDFLDLSPDEQNSFVNNIIKEFKFGQTSSDGSRVDEEIAEKERARSVAQGLTLGFADEVEAAVRNPLSAMGFGGKEDYNKTLEEIRGNLKAYKQQNPIESLSYEMGGAFAPALAAGLFTGGAGTPAVLGTTMARAALPAIAKNTLKKRIARGATVGGAEGGIAGYGTGEGGFENRATNALTGITLGATGGAIIPSATTGIKNIGSNVLGGLGLKSSKKLEEAGSKKILQALENDNISINDAKKQLAEAQSLGVTDVTLSDLGSNLAKKSWSASATPNPLRQEVGEKYNQRILNQAEQISDKVGSSINPKGLTGQRYIDDLNERTAREAAPAYKKAYETELNANPFAFMAKSKVIQKAYGEAKELADIDPDIDASLMPDNLDKYFGDIIKLGGNPKMPTKVAHQIKQGLDSLIDKEIDALTGKATSKGRNLIKMKNAWNKQIADQNPDYELANAKFTNKAKIGESYNVGFDFNKTPEDLLFKNVSKMNPTQREAFRAGIVSQIQELASKTGDTTNFVKTMFGTPRRKAALSLAFENPKNFKQFETFMKIQANKVKTNQTIFGGSQTADKLIEMGEVGGGLGNFLANLIRNPSSAIADVTGGILRKSSGMGSTTAESMSKVLSEQNPQSQKMMLDALKKLQLSEAASASKPLNKPETYSGLIGATSGLLASQDRGE